MGTARLPRSLNAVDALKSGLFVLIFDAVNEASREYAETKLLSTDVSGFFQKYFQNRLVVTSRAAGYLPTLSLPIFELQPIRPALVEQFLGGARLKVRSLSAHLRSALRNPLLLSMYLERADKSEVQSIPELFDGHFKRVRERVKKGLALDVPIVDLLAPIAYELIERGAQTIAFPEAKGQLEAQMRRDTQSPDVGRFLRFLIADGLLVADAEGGISFFHQAAMEFCAARELLERDKNSRFSLGEMMSLRRWDEVIVLLLTLLQPGKRKKLLREIVQVDLVFACRAFELATVKDKQIGLYLFDAATGMLSKERAPDAQKRAIADALRGIAPYGRKLTLIRWLDDPIIGPDAATFLAAMGAKEVVPKLASLALKHNRWPSEFAFALQSLGDESVVDKLIVSALRTMSEHNFVDANAGQMIARFESDEVLSKLALLSTSKSVKKRRLAAAALAECRSDRSRALLAKLLGDPSHDVRWKAIFALSRGDRKPYKTAGVVDSLFGLLRDPEDGHFAAKYLVRITDEAIVKRASQKLQEPASEIEEINASVVAFSNSPDRLKDVLFNKLRDYMGTLSKTLSSALAQLPVHFLLPDLYPFFHVENESLRSTMVDALRMLAGLKEQLPISEEECNYLFTLLERRSSFRSLMSLRWLISGHFQAVSKPIILKKITDPLYPLRNELIEALSHLPLARGDLPPDTVEWLITKLDRKAEFGVWSPMGQLLGRVLDESMIAERVIPLLASSNPVVKNNAHIVLQTAEDALGKRFTLPDTCTGSRQSGGGIGANRRPSPSRNKFSSKRPRKSLGSQGRKGPR
jgi:HEAT repeat protein